MLWVIFGVFLGEWSIVEAMGSQSFINYQLARLYYPYFLKGGKMIRTACLVATTIVVFLHVHEVQSGKVYSNVVMVWRAVVNCNLIKKLRLIKRQCHNNVVIKTCNSIQRQSYITSLVHPTVSLLHQPRKSHARIYFKALVKFTNVPDRVPNKKLKTQHILCFIAMPRLFQIIAPQYCVAYVKCDVINSAVSLLRNYMYCSVRSAKRRSSNWRTELQHSWLEPDCLFLLGC